MQIKNYFPVQNANRRMKMQVRKCKMQVRKCKMQIENCKFKNEKCKLKIGNWFFG